MATESMLRPIEIKTKEECKAFIRALKKAKRISLKEKPIIVPYEKITNENLKDIFSDYLS